MGGSEPGQQLLHLDETLVRLRRLWTASRAHVVDDLGGRVEMSSVLVVEACARAGSTSVVEVTVGDVAAFLDVEPSTASRLVERAVTAGLVRRTPSTASARRTALDLTEAGRALRARATAARLDWLSRVVAEWSHEDLRAFAAALARFADAVATTPARGK